MNVNLSIEENMKKSTNELQLTKREVQLLAMFREGKTSKEIADHLNLSFFTIETHRKNIHQKLGTHKMMHAINIYEKYADSKFVKT